MVATQLGHVHPLTRVRPTEGNSGTECAEAQQGTEGEEEDADSKQLWLGELYHATQDNFAKRGGKTSLGREVDGNPVLFQINHQQAHQLNHHQHKEHFSDDTAKVKPWAQQVLDKNDQCPNHESE